jgi:hypothetical protein
MTENAIVSTKSKNTGHSLKVDGPFLLLNYKSEDPSNKSLYLTA